VTNLLGAMIDLLFQQVPSELERSHLLRTMFIVPQHPDYPRQFLERFGVETITAFGLTDLGIFIYQQSGQPNKAGSCGLAIPEWEVKLVDDYDEEVPRGALGMAVARPREPWLMTLGYWGNPEATVAAYRNLWFHTGDVLRQDEEGWYYYVDRKKDMIRRRGENVSALEVEAVVRGHPAVLECAAYALPSELSEDEVAVAIVLRDGAELTAEALLSSIELKLPYFALPRFVTILNELPKTQTEKVQKARLRERGIMDTTWDRERAGYKVAR
jgi:crotonobetaine/carnitine-CoA ligase